ncbi:MULTISPECIES: hypothetical protein [unclassified Moorena]|uniref:hypothetical protein n=1 Tax=unclassified Moorena TaxID=2683338 RepID=UPI0013BD3E64|nr:MULTISPECIES: hypothetical protein [unclassified Moorena]NEQ06189.1 hypothetical protein [Moorena sp. SIO4E2]NEQ16491.1 hypothetical protein [Moorena sp. SIO3E2]NER86149.1 hypothetical protein [Moorena sp. SIO3A2]NES40476.1 hypothetical protein [Moorena sp. SIO2C4]
MLVTITISIGLANYFKPKQSITANTTTSAANANTPTTRDPWLWPFSQDSIWNMPIGSNAEYKPANLPRSARSTIDVDLLFIIPASSPLRPLYDPDSWTKRCSGTTTYENLSIPIPDDLIVPDAINTLVRYSTPNNAAALLQPDGRTIIQLEPMARCQNGGPVYGYHWPKKDLDLYSQGIAGGHLGSGLSSLGGAIRKGELIGSEPIRHVLKLELWEKYIYYNPQSSTPGYRWPADRADSAAPKIYKGEDPQLVMGSLLAIPPEVSEKSLGLTTPAGKKLFHALQDYGAYQVDVTGRDAYALAAEQGVEEEFKATYGYGLTARAPTNNPFYQDFMKLVQALHIVTNNGPDTVGGGGQLREPLAPTLAKTADSNSD